jgi:hypothetical protein
MSLGNTFRQPIICTNMVTGETWEFISKTGAGKYLGISRVQISHYLDKNIPYKGYRIHKANSNKLEPSSQNSFKQPVILCCARMKEQVSPKNFLL